MAHLRLFGPASDAAGTRADDVPGANVGEVLRESCARYGARFAEVLEVSQVWVNGEPASPDTVVGPLDEVAVLPPVSGGL